MTDLTHLAPDSDSRPPQPDRAHLEALAASALAQAKALGASAAEVGVSTSSGLTTAVRMGEVDTVEYQRDRGFGLTVYFGQRKGVASSADFAASAIAQTVEKAVSIARFTAEDPYAGLADADLMVKALPDLDLFHPWDLTPEAAIELATECEAVARAADARIVNSEGASTGTHRGLHVYGNSHGLIAGYESSYHSLSCSPVAIDESGMQRDYWYTTARRHEDLETAAAVGRRAARRTVRRLGARKIKTCKAPVLFPPELARSLYGHLLAGISGGAQYRKASFLLDAKGERLFPEFIQLSERPHIPRALGSTGMDSEGVATRDRELVVDGVLQDYVLSSYSARKLGLKTTGNAGGIHNLIVGGGKGDTATLQAAMGTGLFVTELIGMGVNTTTGDYSRGAAGFWIENGEIVHPVEEVTIAGNLREMFLAIEAVGADLDERGKVRSGSVLLGAMTIAGD